MTSKVEKRHRRNLAPFCTKVTKVTSMIFRMLRIPPETSERFFVASHGGKSYIFIHLDVGYFFRVHESKPLSLEHIEAIIFVA